MIVNVPVISSITDSQKPKMFSVGDQSKQALIDSYKATPDIGRGLSKPIHYLCTAPYQTMPLKLGVPDPHRPNDDTDLRTDLTNSIAEQSSQMMKDSGYPSNPVHYADNVPYQPIPFKLGGGDAPRLISTVALDVPGLPFLITNPSDLLTVVITELIPSVYQKSFDPEWHRMFFGDRMFFMEEIADIIQDSSIATRCMDRCECDITHTTCNHCLQNLPLLDEAKEMAYVLMEGFHLPLTHMVPWQHDMTYKVIIADPNTVHLEIYGRF